MEFRLMNDHVLKIEPEKERPSRVRLIVKKMGKELVCRKEGINQLLDFIYGADDNLFKGRLQINKTKKAISFYISGNIIGTIEDHEFMDGLMKALSSADIYR